MTTNLCYGIPDVALSRVDGGEINPSIFAGHELVVFFCPSETAAARQEIEGFCSRAADFVKSGAWLIGVLTGQALQERGSDEVAAQVTLATDKDGSAWAAFEELLNLTERTQETEGGTFLFERGGCLAKAWSGGGHAQDALAELQRRD
jgi:thioredoxin-dependent peroxiredoxin